MNKKLVLSFIAAVAGNTLEADSGRGAVLGGLGGAGITAAAGAGPAGIVAGTAAGAVVGGTLARDRDVVYVDDTGYVSDSGDVVYTEYVETRRPRRASRRRSRRDGDYYETRKTSKRRRTEDVDREYERERRAEERAERRREREESRAMEQTRRAQDRETARYSQQPKVRDYKETPSSRRKTSRSSKSYGREVAEENPLLTQAYGSGYEVLAVEEMEDTIPVE